jgi:hypothetical protein
MYTNGGAFAVGGDCVYFFNMRHPAIIVLLLLYVVFAAGFQVLVHTCGGYTTRDVMPVSAEDPCGCADEPEAERCCTTVLVTLRIDADQKAVVALQPFADGQPLIAALRGADAQAPARVSLPVFTTSSPPRAVPLSILHCALLI